MPCLIRNPSQQRIGHLTWGHFKNETHTDDAPGSEKVGLRQTSHAHTQCWPAQANLLCGDGMRAIRDPKPIAASLSSIAAIDSGWSVPGRLRSNPSSTRAGQLLCGDRMRAIRAAKPKAETLKVCHRSILVGLRHASNGTHSTNAQANL